MNVSMQDGFNLGWKLGSVLSGLPRHPSVDLRRRAPPVAQQLIDFDKEWSSLMARKPEEISDPADLATYYLATAEFPRVHDAVRRGGVVAARPPASGDRVPRRQALQERARHLAADGNVVHLGHHARPTGAGASTPSPTRRARRDSLARFAAWLADAGLRCGGTRPRMPTSTRFDAKVIYQQGFDEIDVTVRRRLPPAFGRWRSPTGRRCSPRHPTGGTSRHLRRARAIRDGVVVVVRPDQYVARAAARRDRRADGLLRAVDAPRRVTG
jgi:phenol 2-monooxygenase